MMIPAQVASTISVSSQFHIQFSSQRNYLPLENAFKDLYKGSKRPRRHVRSWLEAVCHPLLKGNHHNSHPK